MRTAIGLLTIWLVLLSGPAVSFGADGHQIVVLIAENHLSPKTAAAINQITDGQDLAKLSLWPDRIRYVSTWKQSKYWHYVNIDDHEQSDDFTRHADGDVLSALDYFYSELQNPKLGQKQQIEALAFFMHFVGDVHQPLHVGRRDDRGGNKINIKWLETSKTTNLHKIWDSQIIDTENKSPRQYSQLLDKASTAQIAQWQNSVFIDWASESKALRHQVYNFSSRSQRTPIRIGPTYIDRSKPIIERRLLMAGVRLADYLNRIFDPASSRQQ